MPEGGIDREYPSKRGVYVPNKVGVTTWFNGDIYSVKLTAQRTGGQIGLIEATVPPGGGLAPHTHERTNETFYVVGGVLEFLNGDQTFTAAAGDVVFLPRGNVPRFHNPGIQPAKIVFMYTPGRRGGPVRGGR